MRFQVFILLFLFLFIVIVKGDVRPTVLRCQHMENPNGVDVTRPKFSWIIDHISRDETQEAYRILLSVHPEVSSGDVWDSGKMSSNQSVIIVYGGQTELISNTIYYWRVHVWLTSGETGVSDTAQFRTGILNPSEWKGKWIGDENMLRTEFTLDSDVSEGTCFFSGLGYGELYANGGKVGHNILDPGWTTYEKRILYSTFDVSELFHKGRNAIGVLLGNGWYVFEKKGPLSMMLQCELQLKNGTSKTIISDSVGWKMDSSPITSDSIYDGETFDARLEQEGWNVAGFNDTLWKQAKEVSYQENAVLSSQMMSPVEKVLEIKPLSVSEAKKGVFVYDMGQNFSGFCRLYVKGTRGTCVQLRHAEILQHDGSGMIYTDNLRSAKATDVYCLSGNAEGETYEPRFTYHGFRYVEVTGYPGSPGLNDLMGIHVRSAVSQIGNILFQNEVLDRIQHCVLWGQATNLMSVPTDCDQRDERKGWMGDAGLTVQEAMYNFDTAAFYENFLREIRDVQDDKGTVTDTVPHTFGSRPADPAWGAAYPILVYYMWKMKGDTEILKSYYDSLKLYVTFLQGKVEDSGLGKLYFYYGDWVPPPPAPKTSGSLTSAYYFVMHLQQMEEMARALGKFEDANDYSTLFLKYQSDFYETFKNSTCGFFDGSQTAVSMALSLGAIPKEHVLEVVEYLVNDIVQTHGLHLTTGILGTKALFEVLTMYNHSDVAIQLAMQKEYPSWGYMIFNDIEPATTIWELWDAPSEGPGMNSRNHIMYGSIGSWFYDAVGGVTQRKDSVGFEHVVVYPRIYEMMTLKESTEALTHVETQFVSPRGMIHVLWSTEDNEKVKISATIPLTSDGTVYVPNICAEKLIVSEGGKVVWRNEKFIPGCEGVNGAEQLQTYVRFFVNSGKYDFLCTC